MRLILHTKHNDNFTVAGLRSPQQRALTLLEKLDTQLSSALGKKTLKTGDFTWRADMFGNLIERINTDIAKWVTCGILPYRYDKDNVEDMQLWNARRKVGLEWVKSAAAHKFAKSLYQRHCEVFKSLMDGGINIKKVLHKFYAKRHTMERSGAIRKEITELLTPIAVGDGDVMDSFSFVIQQLMDSVFEYFTSQVAVRVPLRTAPRYKDREDKAKTYYLCGVVILSVRNLAKKKKNKDCLAALSQFTVERSVAVRAYLVSVYYLNALPEYDLFRYRPKQVFQQDT